MLRLNPDRVISRQAIDERNDCYIVDDLLANPEVLIDVAKTRRAEFSPPGSGGYPGVALRAGGADMETIIGFLRAEFGQIHGFNGGDARYLAALQMTTLQPQQLAWYQRVPHSDPAPENGRRSYAAITYLFDDPDLGGTAFYRWRRLDLIKQVTQLQQTNPAAVDGFLQEHFDTFRQPSRYLTESNDVAELLLMIPARFNRLIFYPGGIPHSAYLTAPERLTDDPSTGRLMLNMFYAVWPASA